MNALTREQTVRRLGITPRAVSKRIASGNPVATTRVRCSLAAWRYRAPAPDHHRVFWREAFQAGVSLRRNKAISRVLMRLGVMEGYGSGYERITERPHAQRHLCQLVPTDMEQEVKACAGWR